MLPDTKIITLRKPVKIGDLVYDRLDLREPTAMEIAQFMKRLKTDDEMTAVIALVAAVTGIGEPVIGKIGISDVNEASDYLSGFIGAGQAAGKNSSQT